MNQRLFPFLLSLSISFGAPQQQDIFQNLGGFIGGVRNILQNPVIQERILKNNLNPCNGVPPTTCTCTSGQVIPFSIDYEENPCFGEARPDQCTCPNGASFTIQGLADNVINRYNLPSCGRGVEPSFCTCRDNSVFDPKTVNGPPCGSRGIGGVPRSCTCPDGTTIDANEFISKVVPAILDILGTGK